MKERAASAVLSVGLVAGVCSAQVGRPALQRVEAGVRVEPVRVARAVFSQGRAEPIGDWLPGGGPSHRSDDLVFTNFGDRDWDGEPDDTECGMGPERWFFGTSFCNTFVTNDMVLIKCASPLDGISRVDHAWYWTCGGAGTERCIVGIFTSDSFGHGCVPDDAPRTGLLLDYGELECNPGSYYYSNADLYPLRLEIPWDVEGSYTLLFLRDDDGAPATCAQPMLWGGACFEGGTNDSPGSQGPLQFDDVLPPFGEHTPDECEDYALGWCPDPLGAMVQFWGTRYSDCFGICESADCNGDGVVMTDDVLCFLNLWVSGEREDCNRDCAIDSRDVLCFLQEWAACR